MHIDPYVCPRQHVRFEEFYAGSPARHEKKKVGITLKLELNQSQLIPPFFNTTLHCT